MEGESGEQVGGELESVTSPCTRYMVMSHSVIHLPTGTDYKSRYIVPTFVISTCRLHPWASYSLACATVTEQYDLVPA